jgi:predicted DNA-binding antitoxin AbrB/MazE fold protein
MIQVLAATFENGVFKPDQELSLLTPTRVRLLVETLEEDGAKSRSQHAWAMIEEIWWQSTFDSRGDRKSRDQLHFASTDAVVE